MKMKNYLTLILIFVGFVASAQEYGIASFLGDEFHKLKMANGEAYNKNTMVIVGHNKHEFGTKLKITNTETGKSVIAEVKDRGPFVSGEIIVVSRKTGEAIGMVYNKSGKVKVEVVGAGATTIATSTKSAKTTDDDVAKGREAVTTYNTNTKKEKPSSTSTTEKSVAKPAKKSKKAASSTGVFKADIFIQPKSGYGVQIGVFSDMNAVIERITQLKDVGFQNVYFSISNTDGKTSYKIIIENYPSQEQATAYKKALRAKYKLDGFVVDFSAL